MMELPELPTDVILHPALLKTPEGDDYTDDEAAKWAWGAHGYDTGMEPFFSRDQLKAALQSYGKACFRAGMERAAKIAEEREAGDGSHDYNAGAETMSERIVAAIRKELECSPSTTK